MFTDITMQRLAFIRYMFDLAAEQSRHPEPLSAMSVLTFHDSVELFLHLACEHHGTNVPERTHFPQYWSLAGAPTFTQATSMERLNGLRNALKHRGIFPPVSEIERSRANVTSFFEENTPAIFGLDFGSISMLRLVTCEAARRTLEAAEQLAAAGELQSACYHAAIALAQLIDDYEGRKRTFFGVPLFFFGPRLRADQYPLQLSAAGDSSGAEFARKVRDAVEALQGAMKILALGLDFRRYTKFRLLAGKAEEMVPGHYTVHMIEHPPEPPSPTAIDDYRFCRDFVIESAIRLQTFDFDMSADE